MVDKLLDDGELIELADDEELLKVLQDIGDDDDVDVKVYRTRKGTKKLTFLYECAPHEFELAYIRDNYGSGDYRVQVRNGSKILANKEIGIEALSKLPARQDGEAGGFDKLVELMQKQSADAKNDLQTMMEGQFKMLTLIMGLQQQQKPAGMNFQDIAGVLVSLKDLFGGGSSAASSDNMLSMFMQGLNLARDLQPPAHGAETNDVLVKLMDQFGPVLSRALTAPGGGRVDPAALRHVRRPALAAEEIPPATDTNETMEANPMTNPVVKAMVGPKLKELCGIASRSGNIDIYTDVVLDQVPISMIGMLLEQPDPVAYLAQIEPTVETYRPWFEALVANIAGVLNDEEEGEEGEEGLTDAKQDADTLGDTAKPESAIHVVAGGKAQQGAKPKPKPKPAGGNGKGNKDS